MVFQDAGTTLLDTILRGHPSIDCFRRYEPIIDEMINSLEKIINNDFSKLENYRLKIYLIKYEKFILKKEINM